MAENIIIEAHTLKTNLILIVLLTFLSTASATEDAGVLESTQEFSHSIAPATIATEAPALLQRGVWQYSIGIEVPPAPRDAKPNLAFIQSHVYGNNILGKGWKLKGLSSIERRSATNGVPALDTTDTFWLEGHRLIRISSAGGKQKFRLEKDDNRVFTYDLEEEEWVAHKDGWTWRWGKYKSNGAFHSIKATEKSSDRLDLPSENTSPSLEDVEVINEGIAVRWHLSQISDPWNNAVKYDYKTQCNILDSNDPGALTFPCVPVISSISYSSAIVEFSYEAKSDDMIVGRTGVLKRHNLKLKTIKSFVLGVDSEKTHYSAYQINYTGLDQTAIQSINQVSSGGKLRRLINAKVHQEPIEFSGAVNIAGFTALNDLLAARPIKVNFDGDGFPDLMVISPEETYYKVFGYHNVDSGALGFSVDSEMTAMLEEAFTHVNESHKYKLTDIDGDGRTELLVPDHIYEWDPVLEEFVSNPIPFDINLLRDSFADINGDGLVDLIRDSIIGGTGWVINSGIAPYFSSAEQELHYPHTESLSSSPFSQELFALGDTCTGGNLYWHEDRPYAGEAGIALFDNYNDYWNAHSRTADYNGDGIADIAYSIPTCFETDDSTGEVTATNIFSRIYWGNGRGEFHSSYLTAGPSFLENDSPANMGDPEWQIGEPRPDGYYDFKNWKSWALTDIDGDGVNDIIHRNEGQATLSIGRYESLETGWQFPSNTDQLPSEIVALSTYVTAEARPHGCWCLFLQTTIVGDWSGDGFEDLLVIERDPFTLNIPYRVKIFKNMRSEAQLNVTKLTNERGGKILLSYDSSALNGQNDQLPFPLRVVNSVRDHRGRAEFHYSGGRYEEAKFYGFAEVEATYESGLLVESKFSLSPEIRGSLISRTERRNDGSIEQFLFNRYYDIENNIAVLDISPPYFNPLHVTCEFEVGKPISSQSGPNVTEKDLEEQCINFGITVNSSDGDPEITLIPPDNYMWMDRQLYGWQNKPIKINRGELDLSLIRKNLIAPTSTSGALGQAQLNNSPVWLGRNSSASLTILPPPRTRKLKNLLQISIPASPILTTVSTTSTSQEIRMFVKERSYNNRQRIKSIKDHKNVAEPDDDILLTLHYGQYKAAKTEGQELLSISKSDQNGVFERIKFSDHKAFGSPESIRDVGTNNSVRLETIKYNSNGLNIYHNKQVDIANNFTSNKFKFNKCGLPIQAIDSVGRTVNITYFPDCRIQKSTFEGGALEYSRDGFGRVSSIQRNNGVSELYSKIFLYDDSHKNKLNIPDYAEIYGNHVILKFYDRWGRIFQTNECRILNIADIKSKSLPSDIECDKDTTIFQHNEWAKDGTQLLRTGKYRINESPTFTLSYRDERGRVIRSHSPSRNYVGPEPLARFTLSGSPDAVETIMEYDVGKVTTTLPNGTICEERFDTLYRSQTCAGMLREKNTFNARGQLIETEDISGIKTTFLYDHFQRVVGETSHVKVDSCDGSIENPSIKLGYDYLDRVISKTKPDGTQFRWEYDPIGRLTGSFIKILDSPAEIKLNEWRFIDGLPKGTIEEPLGRSMITIDPNGNETTQYYDGFGQIYATLSQENRTFIRRDEQDRVIASTDIDGITTNYTYDAFGNVLQEYINITEPSLDYCVTPPCSVGISKKYDGAGRVIEQTDADGVVSRYGYSRAGDKIFKQHENWLIEAYRYDQMGNRIWEWEDGVETKLKYDNLGRVEHECRGLMGHRCAQKFSYAYTSGNQLKSIKVGRNPKTNFDYDELGRIIQITNPLGAKRKFIYGINTPVCSLIDEENIETRWEYDGFGRLIKEHRPGQTNAVQHSYFFDVNGSNFGLDGHLSKTIVEAADDGIWETYFDYANRPVVEARPDGTWLKYDYQGSLVNLVSLIGPDGTSLEHIKFFYDQLGRQQQKWGPIDPNTYTTRNGMPDDGDYVLSTSYTSAGRIKRIDGPLGGDNSEPIYSTKIEYNADGFINAEKVIGITENRYEYDQQHGYPRLKTTYVGLPNVEPRTTRFIYDTSGVFLTDIVTTGQKKVGSVIKKQGRTFKYSDYDEFGIPNTVSTYDITNRSEELKHQYKITTDANSRIQEISSLVNGAKLGTTKYEYYLNNQLKSAVTDWAGGLYYKRDSFGRLFKLFSTNNAGQTTDLLAHIRAWDPRSRPTVFTLAQNSSMELTYNQMGRLIQQKLTDADGKVRKQINQYNQRGLLEREIIEQADFNSIADFTYSSEGWLLSQTRLNNDDDQITDSYGYDSAGNRTLFQTNDGRTIEMEYGGLDGNTNTGSALLKVTTDGNEVDLEWDAYGGITKDHRGFVLERNVLGQVEKIWNSGGYLVNELSRDHSGRPVKITSNAGTRIHSWAQSSSSIFPLATINEQGDTIINAAFEQFLVGRIVNGNPQSAATDIRGNLTLIDAKIVGVKDAFGFNEEGDTEETLFSFGGQEKLQGTPYLSAQQRLYDPELGMFASADPIGLAGGRHRFRYAQNNPMTMIDPWGTDAQIGTNQELVENIDPSSQVDQNPTESIIKDMLEGAVDKPRAGWDVSDDRGVISNRATGERYPVTGISETSLQRGGQTVPGVQVTFTTPEGIEGIANFFLDNEESKDEPIIAEETGVDTDSDQDGDEENDVDQDDDGAPEPPENNNQPLPENFTGTREYFDQLIKEGYTVNNEDNLLVTPGGNYVIPGLNDAAKSITAQSSN